MKDDAAEEPPELASLQPLVDAWCGEMGQVMMNGRWMGWCLAIFYGVIIVEIMEQ